MELSHLKIFTINDEKIISKLTFKFAVIYLKSTECFVELFSVHLFLVAG